MEDFFPQTSDQAFARGSHWGTSVPQTPLLRAPLTRNPEYAPGTVR